MSKALEATNEQRVLQQAPQQITNRAPVAHQQQMQLHAAAAGHTATLQHMNPPGMLLC